VDTLAVGVCGTDLEIINGEYGLAPPGYERLVIGHESVGPIIEAPPGTDFRRSDLDWVTELLTTRPSSDS
jgi:glucose 1-dehydrogenase